jgi:dTDP-4-amino-4,6-dideoxygalactose transaminase
MTVPLVDLSRQYREIEAEIRAALTGVLDKTQFILGAAVGDFERKFADYLGVKHVVAVNSGTSALHLALLALDVGSGDEVICPSWTFIATIEAVLYTGATPVLVDCDPITYNISPDAIRSALTARTKAILPVHLYGRPAEMAEIAAIAREHGIAVVEDAAQAHGARYRGAYAGAIGDVGCFSFYPSKNLGAYGEGGAVTTNNDEIAHKVRMLRSHGEIERYVHQTLGFNMRMEGFQGAVLGVKLRYLDRWNEKRRDAAAMYKDALAGSPLILPADDGDGMYQVYHVYFCRAPERDKLRAFLTEQGIGTGIHYLLPSHKQPLWIERFGEHSPLPVSEMLAAEAISLPMFPEISRDEIAFVAEKIADFYG